MVPPTGFEPTLPPPDAVRTPIMPVAGVLSFSFTLLSVSWVAGVSRGSLHEPLHDDCCRSCPRRGIRPVWSTGRPSQAVGDPKVLAMMVKAASTNPRGTARAAASPWFTMGLDLGHQHEPVVLGEVEEVLRVEHREWQLPD